MCYKWLAVHMFHGLVNWSVNLTGKATGQFNCHW